MSRSDTALLALQALTFVTALLGIGDANMDALLGAAFLTLLTTAVTGVVLFRRRRQPAEAAPSRPRRRSRDEMDARTVLELDERLMDLERREREVAEAERILALMEAGEQSAPAAAAGPSDTAPPNRVSA
ncbi:MAG TPA: hypothetical protein EYQ24_03860 [Bacteroidetes bacterium]|nr:hypothetical protein [Bacteroidota bacterium]HIL56753.1 hypothetical protein [Rhodothermales bacterium]